MSMENEAVSLDRVEAATAEVRRLEAELAAAKVELRAAMREAHERDGETIAAMAGILGVSRQRTARILREAE
jgi:hypothetical protein